MRTAGAPEGNKNASGNSGGKSLQDRQLAAEVRNLALGKMKTILSKAPVDMNEKDKVLHDAILLKLAGTVLPRLNEVSGPDGKKLNLYSNEQEQKLAKEIQSAGEGGDSKPTGEEEVD